ncbi:Uncharacterised protein [Klebsiella quasipneumoniae]|nr:Uncharacterised protein [Klebsiella quasipneumoniae]
MSQGFVATRKMPLNPLAIIVGTMRFTIFAVVVSSSSRLWPGRSAPPETVITAMSTSAQSLASRVEMVIIPGR